MRNAYAGAGRAITYVATAVIGGYAVMRLSMDFTVHPWLSASIAVSASASLSVLPALLYWRWSGAARAPVVST